MNKKRLLVFHPTIAPYRVDFFNSLSERFEAKVCLFYSDEATFDYDKIYCQLLFKPVFLDRFAKVGDSFFNKGYWRTIDDFNPDIIIVGEFGVGAMTVCLHKFFRRGKYRIVSMCDDSSDMLSNGKDFGLLHRIARKAVSPLLDDVILTSPSAVQWYQEHYRKGCLMPIIRREDKQRRIFEKMLPKSKELVKQYQLEGKSVFLFVGRFVGLKNIGTLIKSFSKLPKDDNALVLIGSGEEDVHLRQQVKELGHTNVLFTGRLEGEQLYAWYNVADYFVLPSYLEPFGAVTNEALLAGCYCLISNKAGSQCLIEEGKNGYTFSPMDVDELADKMQMISREFPIIRPLNAVKPNLMKYDYSQLMCNLTEHLYNV